jgi:hypothetical protein
MASSTENSNKLCHINDARIQEYITIFPEISKVDKNICEFKEKIEQNFNILCDLYRESKYFNKVEKKIFGDLKICKIIVSQENKTQFNEKSGKSNNNNSLRKEQKKFKCGFNQCNKTYKLKCSLKKHHRIHLDVKLKCVWPQCKYWTYNNSDLLGFN